MTPSAIIAFTSAEHTQWMEILQKCTQYDVYHLPGYHHLAQLHGEGEARLLVYAESNYYIALPLLLRPIDEVQGLEVAGRGWRDATSVYGYAGPVTSHSALPDQVLANFRIALHKYLREQRVVTLFTRCHSLIDQRKIIGDLGSQVLLGPTVSIRPTTDETLLLAQYRSNHRTHINRLRRLGTKCIWDSRGAEMKHFVSLYHETMDRVNATNLYYFNLEYFEKLWELTPGAVNLCLLELDNRFICSGIFTLCNGIVQYHLSGVAEDYVRLSPMKLLIHEAVLWAAQRGAYTLHLGGGLGAREDALFQFKADFSHLRHEYRIWNWVLMPDIYQQLAQMQSEALRNQGFQRSKDDFYPIYRAAIAPIIL